MALPIDGRAHAGSHCGSRSCCRGQRHALATFGSQGRKGYHGCPLPGFEVTACKGDGSSCRAVACSPPAGCSGQTWQCLHAPGSFVWQLHWSVVLAPMLWINTSQTAEELQLQPSPVALHDCSVCCVSRVPACHQAACSILHTPSVRRALSCRCLICEVRSHMRL